MKYIYALPVLSLCFAVPVAHAQQMKPGLWEVTTQVKLSPEQQRLSEKVAESAQRAAAKMSPEKRQQMEANMAMQKRGTVSKSCLTEADAKADRPPGTAPASCKFDTKRGGNTMTVNWLCDAPKTKGTSTFTFSGGGTAYTSEATSEMGSMKTTVTASGKWLGADCQGVKSPAR